VDTAEVATPVRRRPAKAKGTSAEAAAPKRTRDGSVGRETFAAVEALVKDGISKTDAFKAVGKKTGRTANSVATTYYRVARSGGTVKRGRGREKGTSPTGAGRGSARRGGSRPNEGNGLNLIRAGGEESRQLREIDQLATSLVESVNALASVVKAQSLELADLRRRLDGVRSLLY
jgi:hypothetical protein